ncbi:hypothetical protein FDECE_14365 [Fusarium decemcellulare]|nr:hypothetical protein FDECE_14365 [Fusarium decemcellulare]
MQQRLLVQQSLAPASTQPSDNVECTYQRLNVIDPSSLMLDRSGHTVASPQRVAEADGTQGPRARVEFLLRFTEPSPYGTFAAVIADTAGQSHVQDENTCPSPTSHEAPQLLLGDVFLWDQGDHFPVLFEALAGPGEELCPESDDRVMLAQRASEMAAELSLSYEVVKKNNPNAPIYFNVTAAESVFTEANLRQFVWAYFSRLHSYIPITHQPLFRIETAPLPLLLSIFLFGSLCCSSQDAAISAREFFDLAEAYIFDHPTFRKILDDCNTERASIDEIQIFQAALIIEIIQNGSRDVHTRRRLRLERHPRLVTAMRISGLFRAARRFPLHKLSGTDWQIFIFDELRLRLATWMFFTDSSFAVFYNKAPEVLASEMTGDLPCHEALFEAGTASEYEHSALQLASVISCSQSLSELTAYFLADGDSALEANSRRNLTATELLFCISALQSTAIASRSSLLAQAAAGTLLKATNRWRMRWDAVAASRSHNDRQSAGFTPHAPELWWLTRIIVKMDHSADPNCRFPRFVPTDSIDELHHFIRRYMGS